MKSLLIVELNSTKVRFLKLHNASNSETIARKSFKSNKNLTKNADYGEIQKINEYIKNTLDNKFPGFACKYIYISDSFPPLFLNRVSLFFNNKSRKVLALKLSLKKMGYLLKAKMQLKELKFILYNDKIYIAYIKGLDMRFKVFVDIKDLKSPKNLNFELLSRLIQFDVPKDTDEISIIVDEDFYFKSYGFEFLKKYFKKAKIEYISTNFLAYLHT